MTDGRVSQAVVRGLTEGNEGNVSQLAVRSIFNFPSEAGRVSQIVVRSFNEPTPQLRASQLIVRALIKGRVDEPKIRAWTFTQDGHDYYVLRLGSFFPTLVYDTYSKQWSVYGSGTGDPWRAYTGRNWQGGRRLALPWSDVIVGDDGTGAIYFLSPDDDYDDDSITGEPRAFRRRITGQIVVKPGYISAPCFGVQLYGSIGSGAETLNVNLAVSDDRGFNYDDMGDIALDALDYNARVNWLSLGSMVAPGRLFRITDEGALKRVDAIEMDD
jgi:hypothetical protein